ncbi:DUF6114 domain-containing protein [Streptomyces sp. NPDC056661]|uniref:DUF6114 domain-containing protein n=1 Tax=Streptomyces sp. NPDC056661 TaxID=3345898 RepID=UPI0036774515
MSNDFSKRNSCDIGYLWRRFNDWRTDRPFSAGVLTMLGGAVILYLPYASLPISQLPLWTATIAGSSSLIIGTLLVLLGMIMWFHPIGRVVEGIAAIVLALLSIPMCNLGGFLAGLILTLLGASLSISWTPQ